MITNVRITNFKGIHKCSIENLGNVNLFIGRNDSCKSTILEAVFSMLKEFSTPSLRDVIGRRTNVSFGGRELWYGYKTTNIIQNVAVFDDVSIFHNIRYGQESKSIISDLRLFLRHAHTSTRGRTMFQGPTINYFGANFTHTGTTRQPDYLEAFSGSSRSNFQSYTANSRFIDNSARNDVSNIERLLRDLKLQGKDGEFGKVLYEIFHVGHHWEFVPHPDFPSENRLATRMRNKFAFLGGFGDGLRFGMTVTAESILARNTALFIEEIENNQHPASMIKIVSFLVNSARRNKQQLFLTTHSPFVWRYLDKAFETSAEIKKNLHCYEVLRNPKTGNVDCKLLDPEKPAETWTSVDRNLYEW